MTDLHERLRHLGTAFDEQSARSMPSAGPALGAAPPARRRAARLLVLASVAAIIVAVAALSMLDQTGDTSVTTGSPTSADPPATDAAPSVLDGPPPYLADPSTIPVEYVIASAMGNMGSGGRSMGSLWEVTLGRYSSDRNTLTGDGYLIVSDDADSAPESAFGERSSTPGLTVHGQAASSFRTVDDAASGIVVWHESGRQFRVFGPWDEATLLTVAESVAGDGAGGYTITVIPPGWELIGSNPTRISHVGWEQWWTKELDGASGILSVLIDPTPMTSAELDLLPGVPTFPIPHAVDVNGHRAIFRSDLHTTLRLDVDGVQITVTGPPDVPESVLVGIAAGMRPPEPGEWERLVDATMARFESETPPTTG